MIAKLAALVLPLGMDTFAVAAAIGMLGISPARRTRVSLLFAAFESAMPLIGVALGAPLGHAIGGAADYVAICVLIAFGLFTLLASNRQENQRLIELAEPHGISAIMLGLSISLDELAIGFTLGLLRLPVVLVIILIAAQTMAVTQAGLRLGSRLSEGFREGAERLAGVALAGLGAVLLAEKLLA